MLLRGERPSRNSKECIVGPSRSAFAAKGGKDVVLRTVRHSSSSETLPTGGLSQLETLRSWGLNQIETSGLEFVKFEIHVNAVTVNVK